MIILLEVETSQAGSVIVGVGAAKLTVCAEVVLLSPIETRSEVKASFVVTETPSGLVLTT